MHLTADFGASGCPGTFHLFYVRGVVQMARAEQVLTLPMAVMLLTPSGPAATPGIAAVFLVVVLQHLEDSEGRLTFMYTCSRC